jgi:environmental stress-induced protein Ves
MRLLTTADYTRQPWKNGKGVTTELFRVERDGLLLCRLSMATVAEDGPFSLFPGIERNLTVISGPGFRLSGPGVSCDCRPLQPVAFPGDVLVAATGTAAGASDDFNVMTARAMPRPDVRVLSSLETFPSGDLLALFALGPASLSGHSLNKYDLLLTQDAVTVQNGTILAVRLHGLAA